MLLYQQLYNGENMSNKNPQHINELLVRIGLIENRKVLAQVRDYGQGNHYDLILFTDPESAAEMVEKKLGIKAQHFEDDGSYYWEFNIENEWDFCFEQYRSGSQYMTITDLRPPEEEKQPVVSIWDISTSYQTLKEQFRKNEAALALLFKENFETQMVSLFEQIKPIKAVTWIQQSAHNNDTLEQFIVCNPSFLSFIPVTVKKYYQKDDLPNNQHFSLIETEFDTSTQLNSTEREICKKIHNLIMDNSGLFKHNYKQDQSFCLTVRGLKNED